MRNYQIDHTLATMELLTTSSLPPPSNTSDDFQDYPTVSGNIPTWTALHVTFMAAILLMALIGNTSLCWIILTDHKLRSVPNKLVLNLAVCGLFTVAANGPLILLTLSSPANGKDPGTWMYSDALCQYYGFTTSVYGLASVLTLAVISVNRYQMIRSSNGRFASWFTRSTIRYFIVGVWMLSALLAFPPIVGWSQYEYIPERAICTIKWSSDITYTIFVFTLGIFVPFIVMSVAYFAIFRLVRNKFKQMREHNARSNPQVSCSRNASNNSVGRYLNSAERRLSAASRRGSLQQPNARVSVTFAGGGGGVGGDGGDGGGGGGNEDGDSRSGSGVSHDKMFFPRKATSFQETGAAENDVDYSKSVKNHVTTDLMRQPPSHGSHLYPTVTSQNRRRSRSLVEQDIKDGSRYLQVVTRSSAVLPNQVKSHTLAVPSTTSPNLYPDGDPRPRTAVKSAHARIHRTSSAPVEKDGSSSKRGRGNAKMYRCAGSGFGGSSADSRGGVTAKLSAAGGALLPPKDDLRVTIMVFIVLASFVLCWSPVTVINFLESAFGINFSQALNVFSVYMIFASSAINPLIYGLMNRNFRRGYQRFFCGVWLVCNSYKCCPCCACKYCATKTTPRQNRVSVINLDDTLPSK